MLDRSIPTRKALVHSIPISEVQDMKSDVLWALKASHSEKKTLNFICRFNFNNLLERKIAWTLNFFLQYFHHWDQHFLTPKRLNVRTADKPVLVSVTLSTHYFWIF
jgi:hypothetical protein